MTIYEGTIQSNNNSLEFFFQDDCPMNNLTTDTDVKYEGTGCGIVLTDNSISGVSCYPIQLIASPFLFVVCALLPRSIPKYCVCDFDAVLQPIRPLVHSHSECVSGINI